MDRDRERAGVPLVNVLVAYDSPASGSRAMDVIHRLVAGLGSEFLFNLRLWRTNRPNVRDKANRAGAGEDGETDLVVVACTIPGTLSKHLVGWLVDWAGRRAGRDTALAVLPFGAAVHGPAARPVIEPLRSLANLNGLDFLCADHAEWQGEWCESLWRIHHEPPVFAPAFDSRFPTCSATLSAG
jgi:hypothetical protein